MSGTNYNRICRAKLNHGYKGNNIVDMAQLLKIRVHEEQQCIRIGLSKKALIGNKRTLGISNAGIERRQEKEILQANSIIVQCRESINPKKVN